jgi:integrase
MYPSILEREAETRLPSAPWNKGRICGQKRPLKLQEIWSIRIRLQLANDAHDLALFNRAIDSKLRARDLLGLKVADVAQGGRVKSRACIVQRKTQQPVQFEITSQTRDSLESWMSEKYLSDQDFLFPSWRRGSAHLSTRQYARILKGWVTTIGLDPTLYGTHTMRRTKVSLIYRRTKNLRAVQLLLCHTNLESTVRYPRIEVDDALQLAEQTDV